MIKQRLYHLGQVLLFFAVFVLLFIFADIQAYGENDCKSKSDVAIVLGAAASDNGVSPVFAERINHAVLLYKDGYVDYIIMTGGYADGNKKSDAFIAKEYAVRQGVPENAIFLEEKSVITQQNLEYASEIMSQMGFDTAILVSDPLHMKRSMLMAEDYGIDAYSSPTRTTRYRTWKTILPFILREEFFYVGYCIYRIFV